MDEWGEARDANIHKHGARVREPAQPTAQARRTKKVDLASSVLSPPSPSSHQRTGSLLVPAARISTSPPDEDLPPMPRRGGERQGGERQGGDPPLFLQKPDEVKKAGKTALAKNGQECGELEEHHAAGGFTPHFFGPGRGQLANLKSYTYVSCMHIRVYTFMCNLYLYLHIIISSTDVDRTVGGTEVDRSIDPLESPPKEFLHACFDRPGRAHAFMHNLQHKPCSCWP